MQPPNLKAVGHSFWKIYDVPWSTDSGDTKVGAKDAYASKKIVLQSPELIGKKASIISRQPSASPPHPDLHWCVSSVAAPVLNASRTPVVIRQTPRARHLSRAPGLI